MAEICIPLNNRKRPYLYALIDEEDYGLVSQYRWYASLEGRVWYAKRNPYGGCLYTRLHRLLLAAPPGIEVDHINGDGLDNRRANLRLATRAQNTANNFRVGSSGLKGVRWNEQCRGWVAEAKGEYVGVYETVEDATLAHDLAAIAAFGEYARTNLPREQIEGRETPRNKVGRTHWTKDQDALLFNGMSLNEVAIEVRRSRSACWQRRRSILRRIVAWSPAAEPHADWEDSPQGRAVAGR